MSGFAILRSRKPLGRTASAAPAAWHGRGWQRDASLSKIPGQHLTAQAEVCAMRPINPGTHCAAALSEDSDFAHLPHVAASVSLAATFPKSPLAHSAAVPFPAKTASPAFGGAPFCGFPDSDFPHCAMLKAIFQSYSAGPECSFSIINPS